MEFSLSIKVSDIIALDNLGVDGRKIEYILKKHVSWRCIGWGKGPFINYVTVPRGGGG